MQRLCSKINYDQLEKLFDDSVCASPTPKFLENPIVPAFNFNFTQISIPLAEYRFLYQKEHKQNIRCWWWTERAGV